MTSDGCNTNPLVGKNLTYCLETVATIYQFMTADQKNQNPSLYQFIWEPEALLHRMIKDWLSRQTHYSVGRMES